MPKQRKQVSLFLGETARLALCIFVVSLPMAAEAYVGPGAGLSLLSALWGLICAIGAAFLFVIMWPIRRMRRRRAEKKRAENPDTPAAASRISEEPAGTASPGETARADGRRDTNRSS